METKRCAVVKEETRRVSFFLVKFSAIFLLLHAVIWIADLSYLENYLAGIEAKASSLNSEQNKIFIEEEHALAINASCTGLISISILAGIVFAFRKPELKKKLLIFVPSALLLFFLNTGRLFLVVQTAKVYGLQAGEIVHEISWIATAVFIILLWHYFTLKATKSKKFNELL